MKLKDKALRIIEALVSDDLSEGMEYNVVMGREVKLSIDDIKTLANKLSTIYKVAHAVIEDKVCYSVHNDWRGEINKLYRKYKRANII